jgi:[ribosomal protein S18]-alanine N-acetyltransferase
MAARAEELGPEDLEVVVTSMRRRHLRGVLRIEHRVYPRPWSLGLYMSELALPSTRVYLVARIGTNVIGYAGLMTVGEDGHITTVAVDPQWHRRAVGTRLLLALLDQARARGVQNVTLEVRMSNAVAQTMYRRFGFAPAGVRRGYYVDNAEDAMVMWAHGIGEQSEIDRRARIAESVPGRTVLEGLT